MKKILSWLWVGINVLAGAGLGALMVGGFLGVNTVIPIILAALCLGLCSGYIWYRLLFKIGEDRKNNKRIKSIFLIIQMSVLLIFGSLFLIQRYQFTGQPQLNAGYQKAFHQLWSAVDRAYPYLEEKGIDWDAVYQKYEPRIKESTTDMDFYKEIALMMAELEDAHTNLQSPFLDSPKYADVRSQGGLPIVSEVGPSAESAGLKVGMLVLSVEGISVEDLLQEMPVGFYNAATPEAVRLRKLRNILALPEDEGPLSIQVMDLNGEILDIYLEKLPPEKINEENFQTHIDPAVTWKVLNDNTGYIQIKRLWNDGDEDLVQDFDDALDQLLDTEQLVLDLRGNGGGNSIFGDQIAGRFLDEPFLYGWETYQQRLYIRAWRKTTSYQVQPRGEIYEGKLVILTDAYVMSSAEWLIGALKDSGRAVTIGRKTGGSTGNPIRFYLPGGGWVRYSTGAFYRPNGEMVEGIGYAVDIPVLWTLDDYLNEADPDLEAALLWFRQ